MTTGIWYIVRIVQDDCYMLHVVTCALLNPIFPLSVNYVTVVLSIRCLHHQISCGQRNCAALLNIITGNMFSLSVLCTDMYSVSVKHNSL